MVLVIIVLAVVVVLACKSSTEYDTETENEEYVLSPADSKKFSDMNKDEVREGYDLWSGQDTIAC